MDKRTKTIIGLITFTVFIGLAYFAYSSLTESYKPNNDTQLDFDQPEQDEANNKAPDFTVFDANGNEVRLSDFTGTPIVLNFWASWCSYCKNEMPYFNEVYEEVKDDIVFIMVDRVDGQRETQEKGEKYINEMGYVFPVYYDIEQEAVNAYGIKYLPTTILISAYGNIVSVYHGEIDKETLIAGIGLIKEE